MGGGGSKEEAPQIKTSLQGVYDRANAYTTANTEPFENKSNPLLSLQIFITVYAIAIILFLLFMQKKNDIK